MVKLLLNMKAFLLVALLSMTAQSASAYDNYKEFFFKVTATAQPTGAGKVYVNNITVEYDSLYAETGEDTGVAEKGYDDGDPEPTQALGERELWAKPNPGFAFVGWSTAEEPETILSTERHYTVSDFPVTSTDPENRTTLNYIAHFEERPVVPEFSAIVSGEEYYLYNKEHGVFLVGANDWGTRASVSDEKGLKVKISEVEGGTYQLGAMSPDNADGVWIDGSRDGNDQFVLTMNDDNTFSIGCTKFPNTVLAWNGDVANTRLNFVAGATATWAAVSQEAYDAYLEAAAEIIAFKKQVALDEANLVAIAARENLINATNIYDAEAGKAFADKTAEQKALVEAGNYAETVVNPNSVTGWHASTDYNFLLTPWTIGGEQANNFDKALYINTWSVEGVSDGSNFLVPFFEYWTGDANSLAQNTLATTVSDLVPNGKYTVYATARVRVKDNGGETANGITFSAGESSVNVCDGEAYGKMFVKNVSVEGTADAEGNLAVAFNVAADNNVSWLSYKDVYVEQVSVVEIGATIFSDNDTIALNSHSAVSAEAIKAIEVAFDGVVPTIAGYSINSLVEVAGEESSTWEVDSVLVQGELMLSGKGYAELEEAILLNAGTKYNVVINYQDGGRNGNFVEFEINGAYVEPVDENLIEIAQNQGKEYDDFARAELVEGEEYNTYTVNGDLQIAMKMMNVDVKDCDYVVIKFAEPVAAGWKLAFWSNQDLVDVPAGATEFKYVFAEDPKCGVQNGVLPQICMMTFFGGYEAPLVAKVTGVYKHVDPASGINSCATSANANGKFLENGKVVIVKNGVKYSVAGSIVK